MSEIVPVQADVKRVVVLPNRRAVTLPMYLNAWTTLRTLPSDAEVGGFDWFPMPASQVLAKLREGMHDRINRHIPAFGRGRKWNNDWQRQMGHTAREVNTPRLAVHWLPLELRGRLGHRLSER